ncbi:YheT family hydrolase [Lunatimonas salinarum]|uniref:YheT family hydrolase n=1 Tax=Lunatimonas salinarum TaxID=1774590 RepID=UPI001ADF6679|nr:alpha/beta fold hydrolase [Lunatimonas salinarum]
MPLVKHSSYQGPPAYCLNGHFETIIPSLFRKVADLSYVRERINTEDGDFLDLDWAIVGSDRLLIVSHGLEGGSDRHYAKGLAKLFNSKGMDVLVWNNRSCSGEMNLKPVLYHHGCSDDLHLVVKHVLSLNKYNELYLSGISMGGAQTLKYLGEQASDLPSIIKAAAVYSTPCNLPASAATLRYRSNRFYKNRFLGKLKSKVRRKALQYPDLIDLQLLDRVQDFDTFDTHFTARLHGFRDADDFYRSVSADRWMEQIQVPTLIINALNDPLLEGACYPEAMAENHPHLFLEMPKRGGHTGFMVSGREFTWSERRVWEFISDQAALTPTH